MQSETITEITRLVTLINFYFVTNPVGINTLNVFILIILFKGMHCCIMVLICSCNFYFYLCWLVIDTDQCEK